MGLARSPVPSDYDGRTTAKGRCGMAVALDSARSQSSFSQ